MKRVLLIGAGHAHAALLRSLAQTPLHGARITLVSPQPRQIYSGMLPGLVAGQYRAQETEIDFSGLAERAYAEFVAGSVTRMDAARRSATLDDGSIIGYDLLSLNVGSRIDMSIPGSGEHALPAKPFDAFIRHLKIADRVAIAGGGAAGVELAMALRYVGAAVTLYSARPAFPPALAKRVTGVLRRAEVDFRQGMAVEAIEAGPIVRNRSSRQEFDLVLLTTGAVASPWLRESGLATDEQGFVLVGNTLQSVSHPEVFAAGDCAALSGGEAKSGVFAVRHGDALFRNLGALVKQQALENYEPRRRALALISCGSRYAIAAWGGWSAEGRWAWFWKDRIDRRWVASFRA